MKNRGFINFSLKRCVKINVVTSFIFVAMVKIMLDFSQWLFKFEEKRFDVSGVENDIIFLIFVLGFIIMAVVMSVYSMIVPMVIRIYKNFYNNFTSLIGIILCNFGVAIFLYKLYRSILISSIYLVLALGGTYINLTLKYSSIKSREI
ncbi:MAG: hypothetical protein RR636_09225 [Clostridium sp.]|uniref:hypothetical protein n=1 Tax=Clostridium sp. TaxID=1506 RepID=UPI0032162E63